MFPRALLLAIGTTVAIAAASRSSPECTTRTWLSADNPQCKNMTADFTRHWVADGACHAMHLSISTYMYEAKLTSTLLLVTAFKDTACSERSGAFNKTINKCETDGGGWEETTCDAR